MELEKARGERVNTFMFVAPRVKLFESSWPNLAAEFVAPPLAITFVAVICYCCLLLATYYSVIAG